VRLIVGLGNPGPAYSRNRHNVGYQCVERVAQRHGIPFGKLIFRAYTASGTIAGQKVLLARPLTYMNLSGDSVRPLVRWYHAAMSDLLVVYDDLDLPLGKLRLRSRGSSGGHKGMQSIIDSLGNDDFPRMRVGIGRPTHGTSPDYVLGNFGEDELAVMEGTLDRAVAAIEVFVTQGIEQAMNQYNSLARDPDLEDKDS
jgi:peptidyl-tRNA hydrolase, PTH1 family